MEEYSVQDHTDAERLHRQIAKSFRAPDREKPSDNDAGKADHHEAMADAHKAYRQKKYKKD